MIDIQFLLDYLAQCNVVNRSWADYVTRRLAEVKRAVQRLERFANLRPGGRVALALTPIVADYRRQMAVVRLRYREVV